MQRLLLVGTLLSLAGCELVVDFDRSKIVDDAGVDGATDGAADAADDAAVDAITDDVGPDDGGADAGDDAGVDAGDDAGMMCEMASECDDEIDCTVDACTDMTCVNTPDDAMCDDSNPCTANTCAAAGCEAATTCSLTISATLDLTTVLTLDAVEGGEGGLLVAVFDDDAGTPDVLLGAAALAAGAATDFDVELNRPVANDEVLHVQLFVDLGTVGDYDEGVDTAAVDADAMDVATMITAVVAAGTPDFEVSVSGNGADYTFSGARPSLFAASGNDPELTLFRGHRYRIINTSVVGHPFEFIVAGAPDIVVLSQAVAGSAEGDVDIDWLEDGDDILFTVSAGFEPQVDSYRCSVHPVEMRGTIAYADSPF